MSAMVVASQCWVAVPSPAAAADQSVGEFGCGECPQDVGGGLGVDAVAEPEPGSYVLCDRAGAGGALLLNGVHERMQVG